MHFKEKDALYGERCTLRRKRKTTVLEVSVKANAFRWQFFYVNKKFVYIPHINFLTLYKICTSNNIAIKLAFILWYDQLFNKDDGETTIPRYRSLKK